ncbi:uncharacterized protein LOC34618327 [Cyclospora cayetanensis]|uniref:Uncharacterized protein LOC34618327 n=1 Tax=Cyclospora cayetanensis TaxID=88456 RepID=A0A6P6RVU7_9EIME|nr:uncharacterized protein LOC34618327 [Cyclospora cayetanensis]
MDLAKESRTLTESPPKAPRRFQTYFPLFLSAAVLLLSVFLAGQHHFSLPRPSPPESPPDAFSEGRARLLLQAANRSVRTVGSCDNEVSAPLLLHAAVLHQILMLSPSPSTATSGAASGLATGVGSEMQAAIARLRYVVLVTHHLRREAATDASPTPAAGAAADADEDDPAKPHRVRPSGQLTDLETCLCGAEHQQLLLLQQKQHHSKAAAAAAAMSLHEILLKQAQQQDLPPPCMTHALQAKCAAVLSRSGVHDFFSPSGGAAAAAAFAIGRATEAPAEELPCLDSPRLVDPDLPDFLPGTLIPKFQCISVTRHILAPPSTVSALIGLFLRERQQKAEEQQHEGTGRSFEAALDEAALIGSHQLLMYLEDISKSERDSHVAAAAAAATTAAAAGVPVLEYLSKNHLLSADVSLWGGAAGGFTLTYAGSSRTALYEGPKNITVDFRPVGSRQSMHANSQGTKQTSGQALMLAAHYDSAPSSPGISDDLGMCAVALEVARAAVYRHLRAAHALQLRHWGFSHHAEEGLEDALLQSPLILNLNGAEEVILLAAHAFATQHPLARQVSLAVNLEAAGSRGKSFVLQMPPRLSAETLQAVGNLPAPHVCCIAADVWNSGQFPGETDFRIWSEVLQVPGGLDLAWIGGGASYHTTRDTLESMQPGSLQHTGEMILALLHPLLRIAAKARSGLAAASDARHQAAPRVPFYQDVLGRQLLVIPWEAFVPLAALALLLLLLCAFLQRSVLGVQTSAPLIMLGSLTFGCSCLAALCAACCGSALGALLLQLYGLLYVHWPPTAACRCLLGFAAFLWCWNRTFFRKLRSRFSFDRQPLLCAHAAREVPLVTLLTLSVAAYSIQLFVSFYVLLLVLGLLVPRVALLLFWYIYPANQNNENSSHRVTLKRGCLLLAVDAVGAAVPSTLLFQAYLALLDGLSGPAGRSGESLLFADVLLILGVLLPVWLLLPAVLCPPLFHASHAEARRRNSDPSSARLAQGLQREMRVTRKLWMLAAAVAAAGVSFAVSVFLLEAPAVPLPLHFGRTESSPSVPPYSGEVSIGIQDPHGTASALPPQQRLLQPFSLFGARARSLLGLLPESLQRLLLPSPSFPFSPERPLQLHFVAFRQSKVTAVALLQQSSSPPGTAAQVVKDSSTLSTGTAEESPVVEPTTEASQSQFPPEVQPLTTTNHTEKLVRSSTQGVAVLGLGPQVFWNPAAADTDLVLSAIRAAVEAAEATAAQPASAGDADKGFRPAHAASSQHESDTASRGDVCTSQSSILPNAEQTNALSLAAESLPAFYVKEEPPRQDAPLALPHLFRMSTHRTHWSVYTNAQEFLPPPAPLGNEGAPHVYSPGIRGQVAIHYNDAQDETRLTLLIGGSSLLTLALPADKVVRWNLQNQAPLQKLKKCECYVVTITSPFPPVQTKLEFFFKGNEPVRFTTRSAVFDAVTPNTGCLQTPLFRSVHSYLLGLPMIEQPRLPAKSDLSTAAAAAEARTDSAPMGASSGSGVFWKTLLGKLPPHITAAGSYADAAEWVLPAAPFSAAFAFD